MKYLTATYTDVGIKKDTNQDSMLLMEADSTAGKILLAVMCDGMGGLKKGELASAEVVRAMADWFQNELPEQLRTGFQPQRLWEDWKRIVGEQCERISRFGAHNGMQLGTTMAAFLVVGNQYYIINVGDSRVYLVSDQLYQLTKDHTVVQRDVDMGRITLEQAERDERRSILTQCIGASDYVQPDFFTGTIQQGQVYFLCCDGFRHVLGSGELYSLLNYRALTDEKKMQQTLAQLTEEIKRRGETDNISVIAIRVS